ncbi:MAG TPA: hypothetical protein VIH61_10440, partial [Waddliaceae bacterium]
QGQELDRQLSEEKFGWLQIISGELTLDDILLHSGDGVSMNIEDPGLKAGVSPNLMNPKSQFTLKATSPSEILFFELK